MDALLHVVDSTEQVMDGMGLMRGTFAPVGRFGAGFLGGTIIAEAFHPSVAYNADGSRRPFYFTSKEAGNSTFFPWWSFGVTGGLLLSTFI